MDENTVYFAINNPSADKNTEKKYDFMFKFILPEYEINRQCRFNVRESETLHNLIDKIASNIGKTIKIHKEEKEKVKTEVQDEEIESKELADVQIEEDSDEKLNIKTQKSKEIKNEEIEKGKVKREGENEAKELREPQIEQDIEENDTKMQKTEKEKKIEVQYKEINAKKQSGIQMEEKNDEKQNIEKQKAIKIKNEEIEKDKLKIEEKNNAMVLKEQQMDQDIEENDTEIQKSIKIKNEEIQQGSKTVLETEIIPEEETKMKEDNNEKEGTDLKKSSKINKRKPRWGRKKVVEKEKLEEEHKVKDMEINATELEETKLEKGNVGKEDTEMQKSSEIKKRRIRKRKKKVVGENIVEEVNTAKGKENNARELEKTKMEKDNSGRGDAEMPKSSKVNNRRIRKRGKKVVGEENVVKEVNRANDNARELGEMKMEDDSSANIGQKDAEMPKTIKINRRKILKERKKVAEREKVLEEENRAKDMKSEIEKTEKLQMKLSNNGKEVTETQKIIKINGEIEKRREQVVEKKNRIQDLENKARDQEKTNIEQGNKEKEVPKIQNNEKGETSEQNNQENKEKINKTPENIYVHKNQVKFLLNGYEINYNLTFDAFKDIKHKIIFQLLDKTYQILINQPKIFNLQLPDSLFINFPLYPSVFDSILVEVKNSEYHWYKSEDKNNWVDIGTDYYYTPNESDIGHYLKLICTPKFKEKFGEPFETISEGKVEKFLLNCPFEKRHKFTETKLSGKSFRVVSYNILSDQYIKNHFEYCPKCALNIDYRKQLILQELKGYKADIICLQETDYKTYKNFFRGIMANLDYKSFYEPKLGKSEGLSIYYYAPRFTQIRVQSIVIGKEIEKNPGMSKLWSKIKQNPAAAKKLTEQNTVLKVVVLKSNNKNDAILVIGNVHLYFHPEAKHIRILQTAICNFFIQNICHQVQRKFPGDKISTIFCGDFNSEPTSGVYEFLTKGQILENHPEWKMNPEEIVNNMKLTHVKEYQSAYGTPKYTNYTEDFKACLDYIFYETKYLQIKQVVPLLSEEEMAEHTGLPSIVVPSDHLSLVVDFKWK